MALRTFVHIPAEHNVCTESWWLCDRETFRERQAQHAERMRSTRFSQIDKLSYAPNDDLEAERRWRKARLALRGLA